MNGSEDFYKKVYDGGYRLEGRKAVFARANLVDGAVEYLEVSPEEVIYRTEGEPFGQRDVRTNLDLASGDYTAEMLLNDLAAVEEGNVEISNVSSELERAVRETGLEDVTAPVVEKYIISAVNSIFDQKKEEEFNGPRYIY